MHTMSEPRGLGGGGCCWVSHKEAGPPTFTGHVVVTTSQRVSIKKDTESPFMARLRLQWCGVFPRSPPRRPHSLSHTVKQHAFHRTKITLLKQSQIFYISRPECITVQILEYMDQSAAWYMYCFDKDATKCSYWKVKKPNSKDFKRRSL